MPWWKLGTFIMAMILGANILSGMTSIGIGLANSVEFRGIRPWMCIEDPLW